MPVSRLRNSKEIDNLLSVKVRWKYIAYTSDTLELLEDEDMPKLVFKLNTRNNVPLNLRDKALESVIVE